MLHLSLNSKTFITVSKVKVKATLEDSKLGNESKDKEGEVIDSKISNIVQQVLAFNIHDKGTVEEDNKGQINNIYNSRVPRYNNK